MRILRLTSALLFVVSGCSGDAENYDRPLVSSQLEERTGFELGPASDAGHTRLPEGVRIDDGISEDDAVAIALWNNAPFQETLSELGFARADIIQAGLLANPSFSLLFPIGSKQLEFAAWLPVDALLLRPARIAAATIDADRIASRLVETGLDLIERVRVQCADFRLARERRDVAEALAGVAAEIAEFQRSRLEGGDLSELEADLSRVDALESRHDVDRRARELLVLEEQLRDLLGMDATWPETSFKFAVDAGPSEEGGPFERDVEELVELALAARPDVRAAELGIESAGKRAGLSRWEYLSIMAGIDLNEDANRPGEEGPEVGPALQMELPIFDRNQGGRARADAAVERAARHYTTVRRRIVLEVKEARLRLTHVAEERWAWREQIVPELEEALLRAERVYAAGGTSRLPVLKTRRRLLTASARAAELDAELDRATARLERTVGRRLGVRRSLVSGPEWKPLVGEWREGVARD